LAHTLLNHCVQKTEQFAQLPRLSTTGKGFCLPASMLILVATLLRAGEPVMTLAMEPPPENSSTASSLDLTANTDSSFLNLKNSQPEAANSNNEKPVTLPSGNQIENQNTLAQPESFSLAREELHANKPVSIQAGYGRIWDDQSTLQKICADHQEPGCAYVSANFSF
jgi:hypothetical protein